MLSFSQTRSAYILRMFGPFSVFSAVVLVCADQATGWEREIASHKGRVLAVSVSPDGEFLVSGGEDGLAKVWELRTGKQVCVFDAHLKEIYDVEFLNSKEVLSGGQDGTLRLWSSAKTTESQVLLARVGYVSNIEVINKDHWLVSTLDNVYEWDGNRLVLLRPRPVQSMASSIDRKMIAFGQRNGQISIYNSQSMKELKTLAVPDSDGKFVLPTRVDSLQFSPDNTSLVVLCGSRGRSTIHLLKLHGDKVSVQTLENTNKGWRCQVAFSPDGNHVIAAGFDLTIWHVDERRLVKRINGPPTDIGPVRPYFTAMAFTKEMVPRLAVGCADGKLKLWNFHSLLKRRRDQKRWTRKGPEKVRATNGTAGCWATT